jgi:hypothetical protein
MTDDELHAYIWKTTQQLRELGVDTELTEDEVAQARMLRLANGNWLKANRLRQQGTAAVTLNGFTTATSIEQWDTFG